MAEGPTSAAVSTAAADQPTLWRNRSFLFIWIGNAISNLGDGFHSVALGLWVLQSTGSASAMAFVMAARIIVGTLLGAVAGTVCDRVDRRRLMIAMDLIRTVLVLGMAYLVAGTGRGRLTEVVGLTAVISVASTFFGPAFSASLVNIVGKEQVPQATSLMQIANLIAQVAGPALGGWVAAATSGSVAMIADAASFLVGGLAILLGGQFASPRREGAERRGLWADMREGFAYIRRQPLILALTILAPTLNFFANGLIVLLPVIAVKVWLVSQKQYGLLESLFPLGLAVGFAVVGLISSRMKRRGYWMSAGIVVASVLITALPAMPGFVAAIPVVLVLGVFLALVNMLFQVAFQSDVEPELQGRVFGIQGSLNNAGSPASMLLCGMLADLFTPVQVGVGAGVLMTIAAVACVLAFPALRQYR